MDLTLIVVYSVGLLVVLVVAVYGIATTSLMGLRLQVPDMEPAECKQLPEYLHQLFAPVAEALRQLGFRPAFCNVVSELVVHPMARRQTRVLVHAAERTYAEVVATSHEAEMPGVEVLFLTIYTDGTALLTMNRRRHTILADIPNVVVEDPFSDSVADQYRAHHRKAQELALDRTPAAASMDSYRSRYRQIMTEYVAHLRARGWLRPAGGECFALRFWPALRLAAQALSGEQRRVKALRGQAERQCTGVEPQMPVPVQAEVDAYRRAEFASERHGIGWLFKTVVFLVSVVLFSLAFGVVFSPAFVLILLGVLLYHELGHYAGMVLFGYRDRQILFIPLLGAAVLGSEKHARLHQRVIVSLLGPLPGIVTGYVLLYGYYATGLPILFETGLVMLILNYLNLLPLMPLDGGQIMRMVFFERYPRAQAVFMLASSVLFMVAALLVADPVLGFLGAITLFAVPSQWLLGSRLRGLFRALRHVPTPADEQDRLQMLFHALRGRGFRQLSFQDKRKLVRRFSDWLHQGKATRRLMASTLAVYLLAMTLPVVATVGIALHGGAGRAVLGAAAGSFSNVILGEPDWEARLTGASTPAQRWRIYQEAGAWNAEVENLEASERYYRLALAEVGTYAPDGLPMAETLEGLAHTVQDLDEVRARYRQALAIRETRLGPDHPSLADSLEGWGWTYSAFSAEREEGRVLFERAIAIRERANGPHDGEIVEALIYLADAYDAAGDLVRAEAALKRIAEIHGRHALEAPDSSTIQAKQNLAMFYAAHGRYDEAEAVLRDLLASLALRTALTDQAMRPQLYQELAWVLHAAQRPREAIDALQAARKSREAFNRALTGGGSMDVTLVHTLLGLACLYDAGANHQKAREYFRQAVAITDAFPYISVEDQMKHYQQALALPPRGFADRWRRQRLAATVRLVETMGPDDKG